MLIIDAGNLPRMMQCNGHRLLQADPVFAERDNTIREEGIAAHWLASMVFSGQHMATDMVDRKAPNGIYITAEMAEYVTDYCSAVGHMSGADVEWQYSLDGPEWQVNGRADALRWECHPNDQFEQPYWIHVHDFKYGYSIVEPEKNWTLISHAIGYAIRLQAAPSFVTFYIHQPRAPHHAGRVRSKTYSYVELLEFYNTLSHTLANPSDVLQTGPSCYKCPAFVGCPARQAAEWNAVETSHIAYRAEIDNVDLSERLNEIKRSMELLKQSEKAYNELALHRISKGEVVANYGIDDDLTNREWKPGVTPELVQAMAGNIKVTKLELLTPRQSELAGLSKEFVASTTERRLKGKKLIRINADKKARKMFGDK